MREKPRRLMIEYKSEEAPAGWINGLPASGQLDQSGKGYLAMTARDVATLRSMRERGEPLVYRGMSASEALPACEKMVRVDIPPPSQATIVIVGVETI